MLRVDQVHVIRHKVLVEGKSARQVALEMGVSRNTVRKYLTQSEPKRTEKMPRPRPIFDKIKDRVDELLEQWGKRTTPKQRITGTRVHKQLREDGFDVGITVVRDYLRQRRLRTREVAVPLVHHPGDEAQVDFFEVVVDVDGVRRKAWMFLMRLMYSGRDFAWLYDQCDQLAFLDGHVRAFAHFGAVPQRIVYDNLKPAVRRIVVPHRDLTVRFIALVSHYLFEPCFARPGRGNDKGGVESRGKWIRMQVLTPIPRGETLNDISRYLLSELDARAEQHRDAEGVSILQRFEQERPLMHPLYRGTFEARKVEIVSPNGKGKVRVHGGTYSVPCRWKGHQLTALVGVDTVEFRCALGAEVLPRAPRGGTVVRYRHYLDELARKPQAVRQVAPELLEELGEPFGQLWRLFVDTHGPADAARLFARVIGTIVDQGEDAVREALWRALEADRGDLLHLESKEEVQTLAAHDVPDGLRDIEVEATPIDVFNELLLTGGDHE